MQRISEAAQRAEQEAAARAKLASQVATNFSDLTKLKVMFDDKSKENKKLQDEFEKLQAERAELKKEVDTLQRTVGALKNEVTGLKNAGTIREAMRTLEYFICVEAAEAAGHSKMKIRKLRFCSFPTLKTKQIRLQEWASEELVLTIQSLKESGGKVVHLPETKEALRAAIVDDEDDEEEEALKTFLVDKLDSYFVRSGVPG